MRVVMVCFDLKEGGLLQVDHIGHGHVRAWKGGREGGRKGGREGR